MKISELFEIVETARWYFDRNGNGSVRDPEIVIYDSMGNEIKVRDIVYSIKDKTARFEE